MTEGAVEISETETGIERKVDWNDVAGKLKAEVEKTSEKNISATYRLFAQRLVKNLETGPVVWVQDGKTAFLDKQGNFVIPCDVRLGKDGTPTPLSS